MTTHKLIKKLLSNVENEKTLVNSKRPPMELQINKAIKKEIALPMERKINNMVHSVIYMQSELKSFSWADGLYAIIKEVDGIYHLGRINEMGKISRYPEDNRIDIMCTGVENNGIKKTDLLITID